MSRFVNVDQIKHSHNQKQAEANHCIPIHTKLLSFNKNTMNQSQNNKKQEKIIQYQDQNSHNRECHKIKSQRILHKSKHYCKPTSLPAKIGKD